MNPQGKINSVVVMHELEALIERVIGRELTRGEHSRVRWSLGPNHETQFSLDNQTFTVEFPE